jgi:hypothetical protein
MEEKWSAKQKLYLKQILDKRKGIRTFKSKQEEYSVMVQEATDFLNNIYESNEYTMEQEFKYNFKYTDKEVQEIKDFFENANEEWILVDHSPIFKKHMEWFDYAMEHNTRTIPVRKCYYKKK